MDKPRHYAGLSIALVYVVSIIAVVSLWTFEVQGWEEPSTDFACRPGETYTTQECP